MNQMKYTALIAGLAAASLVVAGCEQRVGGGTQPNPPTTTIINKTEPNPNPPTTVINKSETTTQSGQPDQSSSTSRSSSGDQSANADQKSTASAESKSSSSSKDTKSSDKQPG
jgi:hypothetical protein